MLIITRRFYQLSKSLLSVVWIYYKKAFNLYGALCGFAWRDDVENEKFLQIQREKSIRSFIVAGVGASYLYKMEMKKILEMRAERK